MTNKTPTRQLAWLSEFIASEMGLHFPEARWDDLERGAGSAAADLGFRDVMALIERLQSSTPQKEHIETLARHLTVGETYFFRENDTFSLLEGRVLPELIRSRAGIRRLRIWSAGCSTGEEPYSIAVLITKLIPDLPGWNITVLATDVNVNSLKKASTGVYTEWSFRNTPEWMKARYFKKTEAGHFEIIPAIKEMVTFSFLNLAEDSYPSLLRNTNAMDLIICKNVLMYFSDEKAKGVIKGFYNSLVEGGVLLVSPTDHFKPLGKVFSALNYSGGVIYKKGGGGPLAAEPQNIPVYTFENDRPFPCPSAFCIQDAQPADQPGAVADPRAKEAPDPPPAEPYEEALEMIEQGRYAMAAERLEGIAPEGGRRQKAASLLARAYANQGRLDLALEWCKKAIDADTLNPASHYLLATILQEQGLFDEAAGSLKKALYIDPGFVLAYFLLGNILLRQGSIKTGMKNLENASALLLSYRPEDVLPESEGMTAGRLLEIISSITVKERI